MENGAWNGRAAIERGRIASAADGKYTIESTDRPGMTTPPIQSMNEEEYAAGEAVCFFLFPDGTGRIMCKI